MIALLKQAAVECYRRNRELTTVGALLLVGVVPMLFAAAIDTRTVMGINPWLKPMKFTVSFGIYFLTLGWLLAHLPGPRWAVQIISRVTAGAVFFEVPTLALQAGRGVTSHFNTTTLLDAALFHAMGVAAFAQMGMLAWSLLLFWTQKVDLPDSYLCGIRAGMTLSLAAVLPGMAMIVMGQHSVGVADGGAGLPLVNWSTIAGDLRIAHFLGVHAVQALPLAGFVLARLEGILGKRNSPAVVTLLAAAYALMMMGTFVQALVGQPLVAMQ